MNFRLVALAFLVPLVAGACTDHEQIKALQVERDEWVKKTVLKEEYWKEVARKGNALRELRAVKPPPEAQSLEAQAAQDDSIAEALAPRIPEAAGINDQLSQQIAEAREKVTQLSDDVAKLEEFVGPESRGGQ